MVVREEATAMTRAVLGLGVAALLSASISARAGGDEGLPELNAKVVKFARDHLGQKVDDGQCAMLAVEAYRVAGARMFPPVGGDEPEYVWGEYVPKASEVRPGDVLQFHKA